MQDKHDFERRLLKGSLTDEANQILLGLASMAQKDRDVDEKKRKDELDKKRKTAKSLGESADDILDPGPDKSPLPHLAYDRLSISDLIEAYSDAQRVAFVSPYAVLNVCSCKASQLSAHVSPLTEYVLPCTLMNSSADSDRLHKGRSGG